MAHAAGDAHAYPIWGAHYLVTFPFLDADGDLVTGATTPDAEVSKDLGTFTDCTNESTELATNSGVWYLYLTGAEMTAKIVTVQAKSATAGMKTTVLTLHPIKLPILESDVAEAGGASTITLAVATASAKDSFYNGMFVYISDNDAAGSQYQARRIISYVGSTRVATVDSAWGTNPSNASNYDILIPEGYATVQWGGGKVADPTVAGVPEVDVTHWIGTAAATPTVNGVPEVDVTHVAGSTTSVSTLATSVATLLADIGGVATAAADGDPTNTDLLFAYIKQLINILIGTAGIVAWPASAAPANAVSLAEGLRYLVDQVGVAGAGLTAADDAVIAAIPSAATNAAAVWDMDATAHQTQGTFGQAIGDPAADTGTIYKATVTDATGVTVGTDTATLLTRMGTPSDLGGGATLAGNLSDIEGQTDDIGAAGAGLSAIPWNAAWDAEVQSEATDALNAYDGPTHTEMTAELATADDAVLAAIAALNNLSAAAVNAEVVDALATDTYAEPGQGTPGATTTLALKIGFLYKAWRNKFTTDAGQYSLYNDDAVTVDQKAALSDDGVTYEKGETATGP